jgi:CubicO group peptidase (beta-lactamase class C family)
MGRRRLSIALCVAGILACGAAMNLSASAATEGRAERVARTGQDQDAETPVAGRMDQIVESYVKSGQFMGAVLAARGDQILLNKGYGYADLEWKIPDAPEDKFRLGSITKQFTAASILLLQERGKLNVDNPVKKYMPDAPAAWDKITIFNLLTHTSGIPNFTSLPNYRTIEPFPQTPEDLIALFRDKPLDFQPGDKWSYSNSGYVVLGYLIEKISGQSYAEFLQKNVFDPLGMKNSGVESSSAVIPDFASGYVAGPRGFLNAGYINMTVPFSAGSIYSTTGDLLRWEQGLFGGKLLSAESLKEMTTPFKNDYAFGLIVHTVQGRTVIEHSGGIEGFNTNLAYYPSDKMTIAVLGNVNGRAPDEIGRDLGIVAEGGSVVLPSERKEIQVDPQALQGYVGDYQLAPNFILKVWRDGGRFMTQATGQGPIAIFPESKTEFFAKVVDAQITFVTDSSGKATALILHQNGQNIRAPRVEGQAAAAAPQEHKEVKVDPAILAKYVGTYELTAGFDIAITLDDGQLYEQATGQGKAAIYPQSEKEFFLKVVDAQITFVTDSSGKATGLILHQNGQNIRAPRVEGAAAAAAPSEPKEVKVDPSVLAKYVGTYELAPGFDIDITLDGDQLYEQATGQQKFEIYPQSEKEFFLKVVDAQITFVTDSSGQATSMVLHQNGMDHEGKRIN